MNHLSSQFTPMKRNFLILLTLGALTSAALAAGVEDAVNDLFPKLADPKAENRSRPQIELQTLAAKAGRPGAEAERLELAQLLCAKAGDATVPQPARVWIVRQLEHLGAAESVPTLTKLLLEPDAELREVARRALEKNSAPMASVSLQAALRKGGDSRWVIGLISALGQRHDAASAPLIILALGNQETSLAAVNALGKIASEAAVAGLWIALEKGTPGAADGLNLAANRLAQAGAVDKAAAIYGRLYTTAKPSQVRGAALIGLAKISSKLAHSPINLTASIQEAATGKDARLQSAAVSAAVVSGKTGTLTLMFGNLPPLAKALTVRALDASGEAAALPLAADENESVRLAVLETLGRIGSGQAVPVLLKAAAGDAAPERSVASVSLARVNGAGAGDAIAQASAQGDSKTRVAAINALAARSAVAALPALMAYAADKDPAVAKAASAAIGKIGSDDQIEGLAKLVLTGKAPGADTALQAIASRSKDKSAAAGKVVEMAQKATGQELVSILDVLSLLGGEQALGTVVKYTVNPDADVKDGAIRALCNWPDFAGCKPLLELATASGTQQKHQILAMQAAARLIRSAETETVSSRVEAGQQLFKAAQRDQEKKLAVGALGSIKDRQAGEVLLPLLADASVKTDAAQAVLSLGDALRRNDRRTATKLAEAVKAANISESLNQKADELLARLANRR